MKHWFSGNLYPLSIQIPTKRSGPRGAQARSQVQVHVDFCREEDGKGFYFDLKAFVSVEGMELADVEKLAQSAHKRCPVSKIIGDYNHVTIEVVPLTE